MSFIASRAYLAAISRTLCRTLTEPPCLYTPTRCYAVRKGTRERKQKKIIKKEVEPKAKFVPHNLRKQEKLLASRPSLKVDDSGKRKPVDDVFCAKYYQWIVYPFADALQCHRETHHPDMYNQPGADLHVRVELNMVGEKPTRLVDDFKRIVAIPHKFEHGEERAVVAFSKAVEAQKEALDAGAQLTGGVELIKQVQAGTVSLQDFQYILAHPDILPELVALRGLMKRKFPNPKIGTLAVDLGSVTERFINGVNYAAKKDEVEKDFGLIETVIGTLDMDGGHLKENFAALIRDVNAMRPKRDGVFVSRCLLWSPPSREQLKVDHQVYIKSNKATEQDEGSDVEDGAGERVAL